MTTRRLFPVVLLANMLVASLLAAAPALARQVTVGAPAPARAGVTSAPLAREATLPDGFRFEPRGGNGFRLVRESYVALPTWPDTLVLRWYNEAVDEEIALERGEVDAAMFQAGELSSGMRDAPRWHGYRHGIRSRGALAYLVLDRQSTYDDSVAVLSIDLRQFRGDLVSNLDQDSVLAMRARYETRPFLGTPFYLDTRVESSDSLGIALAEKLRSPLFSNPMHTRADSLERSIRLRNGPAEPDHDAVARWSGLGVVEIFKLGCPVSCTPERRTEIDALGLDRLVDLMGTLPAQDGR